MSRLYVTIDLTAYVLQCGALFQPFALEDVNTGRTVDVMEGIFPVFLVAHKF